MNTKSLKSLLSKLLVLGIAVGAGVGGAALPASATPTDVEASSDWPRFGGILHYGNEITLGQGKKVDDRNATMFILDTANGKVDGAPTGMHAEIQFSEYFVRAAYPIIVAGRNTGYWLQTGFKRNSGSSIPYATCEVFRGEPDQAGSKLPTWESAYQCETTRQHLLDNDWNFYLDWTTGFGPSWQKVTPVQTPATHNQTD